MPAGRPTDYRPEYCDEIIQCMTDGVSYASFAARIGVCRDTLNEWASVHPEFSVAKKIANDRRVAWWEKMAHDKVKGYVQPGSDAITIFMLKNAAPDLYNDRQSAPAAPKDDASTILNSCKPETLSAIARDIQAAKEK